MTSKALDILLAHTKPKTKEQMRDFLSRSFGADYAYRDNSANDITALDDKDREALEKAQKNSE